MFRRSARMGLIALILTIPSRDLLFSQSADVPEKQPQTQDQPAAMDAARAQAWVLKGDAADLAGNKEEALQAYREAAKIYRQIVDRSPGYAALWKKLGFYHWLGDQKDEAIAAYTEAIRLEPDDAEAHRMLGILQQSSDLNASIMEFREVVRLKPAEAKHHMDLGRALAQNGNFDAAAAQLQEACRLNPEDGDAHALLGSVWYKRGFIELAASEYSKALTLKLTEVSAETVRKSLESVLDEELGKIPQNGFDYWLGKATDWHAAVVRHAPGKSDTAAVSIGSWSVMDLDIIINMVKHLVEKSNHNRNAIDHKTLNILKEARSRKIDFAALLQLKENPNPVLKRAALLHTDISMLELETGRVERVVLGPFRSNAQGFGSQVVMSNDGHALAQRGGWSWEYARQLLDSVSPDPSGDEAIRKWYIATTGYMFARRHWAYADLNLKRALKLFPSDARILYYAGLLHESYAQPKLPIGVRLTIGPRDSELKLARGFLQQAVAANAGFAEARLRLGRVAGQLGDHTSAIADLRQAAAAVTDPLLQYYCSLFLGNELAILNQMDEARMQFERAAALYPKAQSPLLSLSRLARKSGDFRSALLAVQNLFSLPARDLGTEDPWWVYDLSHDRDIPALISEMQKAFGGTLR